jgi:hypothetical protein
LTSIPVELPAEVRTTLGKSAVAKGPEGVTTTFMIRVPAKLFRGPKVTVGV